MKDAGPSQDPCCWPDGSRTVQADGTGARLLVASLENQLLVVLDYFQSILGHCFGQLGFPGSSPQWSCVLAFCRLFDLVLRRLDA